MSKEYTKEDIDRLRRNARITLIVNMLEAEIETDEDRFGIEDYLRDRGILLTNEEYWDIADADTE